MVANIGSGQLTLTDMNDVLASPTQPSSPIDGTLWWNTTEKKLYVWTTALGWKFAGDGIILGTKNYVLNSRFTAGIDGFQSWTQAGATWTLLSGETDKPTSKIIKTTATGLGANAIKSAISNKIACKTGDVLTFSVDVKVDSYSAWDVKNPFIVEFNDSTGTRIQFKDVAITDTNVTTMADGKWYRMSYTATATTANIASADFRLTLFRNGGIYFREPKVEFGNIATDYSPAPEDAETVIDSINTTLGNMANDNLIDYNERKTIKDNLTDIIGFIIADATTTLPTTATLDGGGSGKGSFYFIRKNATMAGLPTSDARYIAVDTQYNALKTYLEGLTPIDVWDLRTATQSTNVSVVKDTFRDKWMKYYQAELDLANATADQLKKNVDNVVTGGNNYASNGNFEIDFTKSLWNAQYVGQTKDIIDISSEAPPFKYALHVINATNGNGGIFQPLLWGGNSADALVDKEITISFWLKYSGITQGTQTYQLGRFGELIIEGETASATKVYRYPRAVVGNATPGNQVGSEGVYISGTDTTWKKYVVTHKLSLPSTAVKLTNIYFKHGLESCTGEFWTTGLKIEIGNKVSDWSYSPLDLSPMQIATSITSTQGAIDLVAQKINLTGNVTFNGVKTTVDGWTKTGKTTIDGDKIETNTIVANKVAIGEFANLATVNEKVGAISNATTGTLSTGQSVIVTGGGGLPEIQKASSTQQYLMLCDYTPNMFKQNDEVYFEFDIWCSTASTFTYGVWHYNSSKGFTGGQTATPNFTTTANSWITVKGSLKLTNSFVTGAPYMLVGLQDMNATKVTIALKNVTVKKKGEGSLIVDGTITSNHLASNSVSTDKLTIGMNPNLINVGYDSFEQYPNTKVLGGGQSGTVTVRQVDSTYAYDGVKSFKVQGTGTDNYVYLGSSSTDYNIQVMAGKTYIYSFYAYNPSTTTATVIGYARTNDASATHFSTNSKAIRDTDGWTRYYGRFTAPTGSTGAVVRVGITTANIPVWFDALMLEEVNSTQTEAGIFKTAGVTVIDGGNITTGSLSFDKAQGGTLSLGGVGNELGELTLWSKDLTTGEVEKAGGFSTDGNGNAYLTATNLSADTVASPSIMTKQYDGHPLFNQDTNTLEIFINCHYTDPDPYTGTDALGSRLRPFSTIQDGFDAIPDKLNTGANIWIHNGIYTEDITLAGIQGNGFIRIRPYLEKVRYLRVWGNGNTVNAGVHIVEIQAFNNNWYDGSATTNLALNKTITGNTTWSNPTYATDGVLDTTKYMGSPTALGDYYAQIDFGSVIDYMMYTRVHYYWSDRRKYNKTKIEVSDNGTTWRTLWDSNTCGTFISSPAGWNSMPSIIGKLTISNISASIIFQDLRFYGAELTEVLEMRNSFMPEFYYCHFFGNANTTYLIKNYAGSSYFLNCEVNTADTYLFYSANGGNLAINNVIGGDCPTALGVRNGGQVVGIQPAPKGMTADTSTYTGGTVSLSSGGGGYVTGNYTVWQVPTDPAPTPPPAPTYATVEVSSTSSDSYRTSVYVGWRSDSNYVYQGQYGYGMHKGVWMFNTGLDFLSGKTITKMEIYVSRRSEGGNSGASTFTFRPHIYKTKPAGDPAYLGGSVSTTFKWGEGKWVNITSLASYFTSSGAKGIMLYNSSTSSSYYGIFNTSAKIRVTYQK